MALQREREYDETTTDRPFASFSKQQPRSLFMYTSPYEIYTDQRYFDRELSRLFSQTWTFGCTWPEIEKTASFVVANTPMGEVIITNREGNPQAFFNKCLHRGHRLTDKKRGLTATFPVLPWLAV